jgi:hypothetical protein
MLGSARGVGVGHLWDHDDAVGLEPQLGYRILSDCVGGNDDVRRTRKREVAQTHVHSAGAQALAAAGERIDVVNGHDHRTGAAQDRALRPRRVEHLDASWAVGLHDLRVIGRGLPQRREQGARIASDTARVG